jgi:hypothetical protein
MSRALPSRSAVLALVVLAPWLAHCAGPDSAVHPLAVAVGAAHADPKIKPFVAETRPAELKYIPVGTSVTRPARKLTPAEFAAYEAELNNRKAADAAAGVAAQRLGATPPPAPPKVN